MRHFTEERIRQIYANIPIKNMPFEEFRKQIIEKTNPQGMMRDAMRIVANKRMIDNADR